VLTVEDALVEARTVTAGSRALARIPATDAALQPQHGLTRRENDVLRLLAEGLTDREIAERLFITRRTASNHVAAILAKLDVPNRRAAAAGERRCELR
jgi:DNA-binding CsgD family transcriptional regulator